MKNLIVFLGVLPFVLSCAGKKNPNESLASEAIDPPIEKVLQEDMIEMWYPRVIDTINGGYYSTYTYDWQKTGPQNKFIVTQSRHVWTLAFLYERYDQKQEYLNYATHGFDFLKDHMWDDEYGGFYDLVDSTGNVPEGITASVKKAYGNSFAIYALAQYFKVSHDEQALDLAKKAFLWLEKHSHDDEHGGYFQLMQRDGSLVTSSEAENFSTFDRASIGIKDFNSSIHLLEAFTTLYQVWPDDLVKKRLQEMYDVVTGPMYDERGFLKLYFYPDWTLVRNEDSDGDFNINYVTFGHDVETAFLLYESAEVLGIDKSDLLKKMQKMVNHALDKGWDDETGGFYDQGQYVSGEMKIINHHKEWWGQAEALNTFLLMSHLFPDDEHNYYQKFVEQWNYVNKYLIDPKYKGWYAGGIDENPDEKKALKAQIWKGNYHTTRALVSCINRMNEK